MNTGTTLFYRTRELLLFAAHEGGQQKLTGATAEMQALHRGSAVPCAVSPLFHTYSPARRGASQPHTPPSHLPILTAPCSREPVSPTPFPLTCSIFTALRSREPCSPTPSFSPSPHLLPHAADSHAAPPLPSHLHIYRPSQQGASQPHPLPLTFSPHPCIVGSQSAPPPSLSPAPY